MFSIIIILQDAVFTGNHYYIPEPVIAILCVCLN